MLWGNNDSRSISKRRDGSQILDGVLARIRGKRGFDFEPVRFNDESAMNGRWEMIRIMSSRMHTLVLRIGCCSLKSALHCYPPRTVAVQRPKSKKHCYFETTRHPS